VTLPAQSKATSDPITNPIANPIIIALDVETAAEARTLVHAIGDAVSFYKVGLELFTAAGMDLVRELRGQGHRVFLDLKFHDIGETVKRAVAQVARAEADFLTVHATHGVMQAAVAGRAAGNPESALKLLAVTVLTSVDENDLRLDGYCMSGNAVNVPELVALRVKNAMQDGIEGIVCSALEVARVRAITGPGAILVVPGVRSAGAAVGDQKRVATPAEAIANGATHVVVGRQVTRAADPRGEALKVLEEIRAGAAAR
jgi:orotidine-5'-phosphate decarboxylase